MDRRYYWVRASALRWVSREGGERDDTTSISGLSCCHAPGPQTRPMCTCPTTVLEDLFRASWGKWFERYARCAPRRHLIGPRPDFASEARGAHGELLKASSHRRGG